MSVSKEERPTWARHMLESVKIQDIYRSCEPTSEDLTLYLPSSLLQVWIENVIDAKEYVHFWSREEESFEIYTIFYAYLDRYIINPKCCTDNRSKFDTLMLEQLTQPVLDKINSGYEMLDKIEQADSSLFPNCEWWPHGTIYTRLEHFFEVFSDTCCSCMNDLHTASSTCTCVSEEIIKEEIIHYEHWWYNTGFRNVYQLTKPVSFEEKDYNFNICVVPKPLTDVTSVNDLFIHRAVLVRFTHCKSCTTPHLSRCCANLTGEILSWDMSIYV